MCSLRSVWERFRGVALAEFRGNSKIYGDSRAGKG